MVRRVGTVTCACIAELRHHAASDQRAQREGREIRTRQRSKRKAPGAGGLQWGRRRRRLRTGSEASELPVRSPILFFVGAET